MQTTSLLKKALKPRNLTPGTPTPSSAQAGSGGGGSSGSGGSNKKENVTRTSSSSPSEIHQSSSKPACTCSPTTHAGSFRCHLHRRSHGLTPSAMPKSGGEVPNRPFRGSSSYTISSLDIHYHVPSSSSAPKSSTPGVPGAKTCPRHHHHHNNSNTTTTTNNNNNNNNNNKPSRLSRMEKASPVIEAEQAEMLKTPSSEIHRCIINHHHKLDEMSRFMMDDESMKRVQSPALDFEHEEVVSQAPKDPDEMYTFGSDLDASEQSKGGSPPPPSVLKFEPSHAEVPEIYNRLYTAEKTPDFITSEEVKGSYIDTVKSDDDAELGTVDDTVMTQKPEELDDGIPVVDPASFAAEFEENKLYVEPLRIIDFKQEFLPKNNTCTTFLVQWQNLSVRDATWESSYFIRGYPELLQDFLQRRSEQGDSIEFFRVMENVNRNSIGADHLGLAPESEADSPAKETPEEDGRGGDVREELTGKDESSEEEEVEEICYRSDEEEEDEETSASS